jgi:hypothetical protein
MNPHPSIWRVVLPALIPPILPESPFSLFNYIPPQVTPAGPRQPDRPSPVPISWPARPVNGTQSRTLVTAASSGPPIRAEMSEPFPKEPELGDASSYQTDSSVRPPGTANRAWLTARFADCFWPGLLVLWLAGVLVLAG